jgi:hypothetical protein
MLAIIADFPFPDLPTATQAMQNSNTGQFTLDPQGADNPTIDLAVDTVIPGYFSGQAGYGNRATDSICQ